MTHIIDRRLNPSGKNSGNRQRFVHRIKDQVRKAVKESIQKKDLKDLGQNNTGVKIPVKGVNEPTFSNSSKGGNRTYVTPGNKEFVPGDGIAKPQPGGGQGNGTEGGTGDDTIDGFEFTLTRDEFLDVFFEDLELPDLVKKTMKEINAIKMKRSGYTNSGSPTNLDVKQTFKNSLGRRIGLHRPKKREIEELEAKLEAAEQADDLELIAALRIELEDMIRRRKGISFIDPIDTKFRHFTPQPEPNVQALMVCLMDVSGSMDEAKKDIAKRFFMLLYLFLERKYEKIDIVFVRHTTTAEEVDEHTFFYDRKSGGTMVSSGLEKVVEIIRERYPTDAWNIYCAQASDGDNYGADNGKCMKILTEELMPLVQYMAYVEIMNHRDFYGSNNELWNAYQEVEKHWNGRLATKKISNVNNIYPVFRDLFNKESSK